MTCTHLDQIRTAIPRTDGCEECLRTGDGWVHLRLCLTCGHVGCCDDSKNKHATAHFHSAGHPVIESLEPGENWRWCYVDDILAASEIDEDDTPFERESVMSNDTLVLDRAAAKDGKFSRQSLPLIDDISSNGHSRGMFKSICQRVRRCNKKNRPLILDPLAGHNEEARQIRDVNLRGTIKELAQLDGAFVVSDQGIVVAACRYLDAMASDVALPYGMASRHLAGASISQVTDAVAIVVSESSMVRVFDDGKLVAEIIPELWLMDHYNVQLSRPYQEERVGDLAVLTAES